MLSFFHKYIIYQKKKNMIKKFEEFKLGYFDIVNEGYQSNKLRNLIKQHGLPRERYNLYDIKDSDIIDVVGGVLDYYKKYSSECIYTKSSEDEYSLKKEATFLMQLEDGTCVVLSNMGILSGLYSDWYFNDIFRRRHAERHKGNLGKPGYDKKTHKNDETKRTGDDINDQHKENVYKLNYKKNAKFLIPYVDEIVDEVEMFLYELVSPNDQLVNKNDFVMYWIDDEGQTHAYKDIKINGDKYHLNLTLKTKWSNIKNSDDTFDYYDLYYTLEGFTISKIKFATTSEALDITKETHEDLFKRYTKKNARTYTDKNPHPSDIGRKGHRLVKPANPNSIYN